MRAASRTSMKLVLQWPNNGPVCEFTQGQLLAEFRGGKLPADCTVRRAEGGEWVTLRRLFANESGLTTLTYSAPGKPQKACSAVFRLGAWLLRLPPVVFGAVGGVWSAAGVFYLISLVAPLQDTLPHPSKDLLAIAFQISSAGWAVVGGIAGPWFLSVLKPVLARCHWTIVLGLGVNFGAVFGALLLLGHIAAAVAACVLPALLFNARTIAALERIFPLLRPRELLRRLPLHRLKPFLDTPEGRRLTRILKILRSNRILQTWLIGLCLPVLLLRTYLFGLFSSYYLFILICFLTPFPLTFHRRGNVTFFPALLITLLLLSTLRLGMPSEAEYWNRCFEEWWQSGLFWGDFYVIPVAVAFLGCSAASATYQLVDRLRHRSASPTDGTLGISAIGYLTFFLTANLNLVAAAAVASRWLEANRLPPFQDGLYHAFGLFPDPPTSVYRLLASPVGMDYTVWWMVATNLAPLVIFRMVGDSKVIAPAAFLSFVVTGFPAFWAVVAAVLNQYVFGSR